MFAAADERLSVSAAAGRPPAASGLGRGPQPARTRITTRWTPAGILKLNAWIKDYAPHANAIYVDYFAALVDEKGFFRENLSGDGLHPNAEGYKIMVPIAEAAIQKALQ